MPLFLMDFYAPSFLDKLLGETGDGGARGIVPRLSIDQLKDSVARDIERLLNTHAAFDPADLAAFPHIAASLLTMGLADISSMSMASDRDRKRITEAIQRALSEHDRRLTEVEVRVRENTGFSAGLRFVIRAKLMLEPDVEPVSFDAVLQPGSNRYAVAKAPARGISAN